jgi:purine-nucleoside phosphorylase
MAQVKLNLNRLLKNMLQQVNDAVATIRKTVEYQPQVGIVLGTGLGNIAQEIDVDYRINYSDIPHFKESTVAGHHGRLIFGTLAGKKVVAMQGRLHFYEGYTGADIIFPIRVLKFLGIETLILSNASGGMNPDFEVGDIMIQTDHINLIPNPLIGPHNDAFGERFPDMSDPYEVKLISKAQEIAKANNIKLQEGTYVAVTGPTLETPAEYAAFRIMGGDAVGMSTVPEVIAARQMKLPCFALSVITDLGVPGKIVEVTHDEVQRVASEVEPKVTTVLKELIESL